MNTMNRMLMVLMLVAGTSLPAVAQEGGSTRDVANQLAKKVREVAGGLKPAQAAVKIGLFNATQDFLALGGSGGGFMAELEQALNGFLSPTAPLELTGQVFYVDDIDKPGLKVVKVKAKLVDKNGNEPAEFKEFEGFVRKVADIAKLAGPTVAFKPDSDYSGPPSDGRNHDFQKTLPPGPGQPPKVVAFVDGTFVRTSKASPYAVEIRKKPLNASGEARPVPVELRDGLPFAPIAQGDVYEVRVVNHSHEEIAVSLAVDGIDQFTFSEDRRKDGAPRFSHWIVGAGKEVVILGWHKTADGARRDNIRSFLVTEYGQGAASKFPTRAQGKLGTITVGVSRSYLPGPNAPRSASETGFGPDRELKQVVVERKIDDPHEFITVRYSR